MVRVENLCLGDLHVDASASVTEIPKVRILP